MSVCAQAYSLPKGWSYNSFAGADLKAVIGQFQFAELQAISYSITREKAPVYTMGSADVRAYSRNKRGIAGSLIWINFDRHALLNVFRKARGKFVADKDEIRPQYQESTIDASAIFTSSVVRDLGTDKPSRPGLFLAWHTKPLARTRSPPAPSGSFQGPALALCPCNR
ncbi:MAG TPA: hypothetical protein VF135_07705 [Terriglobales bacterium]